MWKKICLMVLVALLVFGCTMGYRNVGNSAKWPAIESSLKIGSTTESEVLKTLGPPSLMDMKSISGQTIYYYWMEKLKNKSLYLMVYNYWDVDVKYDRAMFIFDKAGLLQYYGISYDTDSKTKNQ